MGDLREPMTGPAGSARVWWPRPDPCSEGRRAVALLLRLLATDAHRPGCRHLVPQEYVCDCGKAAAYAAVRGEACRWLRELGMTPEKDPGHATP